MRARIPLALWMAVLVSGITLAGSVGDPTPRGFVTFDEVRRSEFSAVAVQRDFAPEPFDSPLLVRVSLRGDAADADWSEARKWLAEELDVHVVPSGRGVPLYLTKENLIATSGPAALGATVRSGMVVEVRDDALAPCVLAHELLHFLGLHHVDDKSNILYPRCGADKLDRATVTDEQRAHVASLRTITAVTPTGIHTWAERP